MKKTLVFASMLLLLSGLFSVIVRFTDSRSKDTIKALMIYRIPKGYQEPQFTDTLASHPATKEQVEKLNQFVNEVKKGK